MQVQKAASVLAKICGFEFISAFNISSIAATTFATKRLVMC